MAQIFISHSSRNSAEAARIQDWLVDQGWGRGQIFLDLDDLSTGDRWRERLNHIGATCEAVIVCLSDDWIKSPECVREFTHAESRGKPVFPVQISGITERIPGFVQELQTSDITTSAKSDGFAKLRAGLLAARIGPEYFPWPPHGEGDRSPYRGLQPFEEKDAAAFFGRDDAITRGLDTLRRMRHGTPERIFVVLGASGAGKSSFLRAGLLSRLARDEIGFSLLPVLRPEEAALTGGRGLRACLGLDADYVISGESLGARVAHLHAAAAVSTPSVTPSQPDTKPPTLVLPIDQGEEFFGVKNGEGKPTLGLLCDVLRADGNTIAIVTIRSDSYERLQGELHRHRVQPLLFDLPAMSPGAFKEVIEGPGQLVNPKIEFEAALSDRLIEDLESASALPLLAFTLERLVDRFADDHRIELTEYTEGMGGLSGAIESAVESALTAAAQQPTLPDDRKDLEALARRTFIPWLVQLDVGSPVPKRRRAHRDDLPEDGRGLVDCLVEQRLLLVDSQDVDGIREVLVEVTHEAVLRHWPLLSLWLEDEASNLHLLDNVKSATQDWLKNERASDWLVHSGRRLASAEGLLVNPLFTASFSPETSEYLAQCEEHQKSGDREEFTQRMTLVRDELGEDIFQKLEELQSTRASPIGPKEGPRGLSGPINADTGRLEGDIQQRKNKLLDHPMWHPSPAVHVGSHGPDGDYAEIWQFPCCRKILHQDAEPSQERADGCKRM